MSQIQNRATDASNPFEIVDRITDECLSLKNIVNTLDEFFPEDLSWLTFGVCHDYSDDMKSKYKLEDALKEALVTEELQKLFSDFDALCSREVAAVQQTYLSLGIVFGMKLAGASQGAISNVWRMLGIGKSRSAIPEKQ